MDEAGATERARATEGRASAPRLMAAVVSGFFIFIACLGLLFATYEERVPAAVLAVVSLSIASLGGWLVFKLFDGRLRSASNATSVETKPSDEVVFGVLSELMRQVPKAGLSPAQVPKAGLSPATLFALSLMLFVTLDLLGGSSTLGLACLVGVLALHEAGHAVAMRAFGYRDVRIFFVPFLGAATAGRKTTAPVWQRAVVLLAGPVPGLALGLSLQWLEPAWLADVPKLAPMLIWVNALNLVPADPLDGGRLAGLLIFGGRDKLRIVVSSTLALIFVVLLRLDPLVQSLIIGAAVGTQVERWRTATLAARLRRSRDFAPERLPNELALAEEPMLRRLFEVARGLESPRLRGKPTLFARLALARMRSILELLRAPAPRPLVAVPVAIVMFAGTLSFASRLAARPRQGQKANAAEYDLAFTRGCTKTCRAEGALCSPYCNCVLEALHGPGDREASTRWLMENLSSRPPTNLGKQRILDAQRRCVASVRHPNNP